MGSQTPPYTPCPSSAKSPTEKWCDQASLLAKKLGTIDLAACTDDEFAAVDVVVATLRDAMETAFRLRSRSLTVSDIAG